MHVITDPKKVQGIVIVEMTALQDKQQLQSSLGMVNNVENFIPHLSHHTEQDSVFHWDEVKTRSFQQIKSLILKANDTPLMYYDRSKPVTVQADASPRGLGKVAYRTISKSSKCQQVFDRCRK